MSMTEFVHVMLHFMPSPLCDAEHLRATVGNLCEMFEEIDVNGDGEMEWDEFMSFIIEEAAVSKSDVGKLLGEMMHDTPRLAPQGRISYVHYLQDVEKLLVVDDDVIRVLSAKDYTNLRTLAGHKGRIVFAEVAHPERCIITIGADDHSMVIWSRDTYSFESAFYLAHTPVTACWVSSPATLYVGTAEGFLYCFKLAEGPVPEAHVPYFKENLPPVFQKFICSVHFECVYLKQYHQLPITCITWLPTLQCAVTGSAAGTANVIAGHLHNLTKNNSRTSHIPTLADAFMGPEPMQRLSSHHARGITSVITHRPGVLVSTGNDPKPRVWDLNQGTGVKPSSLQTNGHHNSVTHSLSLSTRQIATFDSKGVVKIWDTVQSEVVQTLHLPAGTTVLHATFISGQYRIVLATTRGLMTLTSDSTADPWRADSRGVSGALYSTVATSMCAWSGQRVKFWDGAGGVQHRTLDHGTPLNCLCLDERERKIILGDGSGRVSVYNFNTGAFMKEFTPKHGAEVSSIHYAELRTDLGRRVWVISSSWDGTVHIYDDDSTDGANSIVRRLDTVVPSIPDRPVAEVTAVAVTTNVSLLVSGDSTGFIKVTDLEAGSLEGVVHHLDSLHSDITACTFLDPYPVLATFDSVGYICLWSMRPCPIALQLLACFKHGRPEMACNLLPEDPNEDRQSAMLKRMAMDSPAGVRRRSQSRLTKRTRANTPFSLMLEGAGEGHRLSCVLSAAFEPDDRLLFTVDDEGCITAYDLLAFFEDLGLSPVGYSRLDRQTHPPLKASFPGKELMSRVPGGRTNLISVKRRWKGHNDAAVSVSMIPAPPSLVTASLDGNALVWTRDGQLLAALQQGVTPDRLALLDHEAEAERRHQEIVTRITADQEKRKKRKAALRRAVVLTTLGRKSDKTEETTKQARDAAQATVSAAMNGEAVDEEVLESAAKTLDQVAPVNGANNLKNVFALTGVDAQLRQAKKPPTLQAPDLTQRIPWQFVPDRTAQQAQSERNVEAALANFHESPELKAKLLAMKLDSDFGSDPEDDNMPEIHRPKPLTAPRRRNMTKSRYQTPAETPKTVTDSLLDTVKGMPASVREAAAMFATTVNSPLMSAPAADRTPLSSWPATRGSR
ncbi:WD domain, G-beta repeat [Carpediemonas membranifera]|uniref:WD domain, G-beta repeat n=1 Tax=Carpediemonas membranifera TaxID=201153 RepID=A0A8J6B0J1_9EUKA|nr:WD domain, G-beta repeat [Carpediemonas membranifera]|eukprot:KAG9392928.1 WD domain, G-beta repeat [Carpediemonas membranifera]